MVKLLKMLKLAASFVFLSQILLYTLPFENVPFSYSNY